MRVLKVFSYASTSLAALALLWPREPAFRLILWPFKLVAGALTPFVGLVAALGAILGLVRRDPNTVVAGVAGAGLAARFLYHIPDSRTGFAAVFGPDWEYRLPTSLRPRLLPRRWSLLAPRPGNAVWQRDVVYAHNPERGDVLRADVWRPPPGVPPTGLAAIYVHGGAWRVGDKDMATRTFFRRLAGQGYVIVDIAYSLWPKGDIPRMVSEVKQAVVWMKENADEYGVDPERVVLMGGSAGGHLALLAAYTDGHPALPPLSGKGDTSVRGVIAFHPPCCFLELQELREKIHLRGEEGFPASFSEWATNALMGRLLAPRDGDPGCESAFHDYLSALLGVNPEEEAGPYQLLSPIYHVGPHCPPTLLLQGSDDIFVLAPAVRRMHRDLCLAGAGSILVEFPHTEHAFDLILPRISPVAQAATYDVERFLALLL